MIFYLRCIKIYILGFFGTFCCYGGIAVFMAIYGWIIIPDTRSQIYILLIKVTGCLSMCLSVCLYVCGSTLLLSFFCHTLYDINKLPGQAKLIKCWLIIQIKWKLTNFLYSILYTYGLFLLSFPIGWFREYVSRL